MSLGLLDARARTRSFFQLGAAAAAFAITAACPGTARASGPVSPTGKGIVGGALLGGEVVTITMGAIGVQRGWPYFVFGGVGMVGGAVGGFFVEKATKGTTMNGVTTGATAEPALYMLAGGMALVIPALVVSLNATAYKPPESDRSEPAANEPAREAPMAAPPPAPGAAPPAGPTTAAPKRAPRFGREVAAVPHIPTSLVDVYQGKLALRVPAVEVRPLYTPQEMAQYGVAQRTELRFPIFKAMF